MLVAPFDAPWVRMTVISDPQGATFTASKFVPENKDLAAGGRGRGVMQPGRAPQAAPAPCSAIQSRVSVSQNASPAYSR